MLGHLDRASSRRCWSRRSRTAPRSSTAPQLSRHRGRQIHSGELDRDAAALRHRHRLRLGERRRPEHQPERGRRTDVAVQLGDVGDHVDRPRRERLRRCLDGRDDEIRPQPGDRGPTELDERLRGMLRTCTLRSPSPLAGPARARSPRLPGRGDGAQHTGQPPVDRNLDVLQSRDGRDRGLGVDLNSEEPALRARERADLKGVWSSPAALPPRALRARLQPTPPHMRAGPHGSASFLPPACTFVSFVVSLTRDDVRRSRGSNRRLTRCVPALLVDLVTRRVRSSPNPRWNDVLGHARSAEVR